MSTATHPRPLLTIPEAAERLAVSESTLRRRIAAGELPVVRLGAPVRVHPADLDEYVTRARCERRAAERPATGRSAGPGGLAAPTDPTKEH